MADLGYFLQAFNPVDFIKGYEQSEKFATEQDLAKARATTARQAAEKEGILLGEFKQPGQTETRNLEDELKRGTARLGGLTTDINYRATSAEAPTLEGAVRSEIRTAAGKQEAAEAQQRSILKMQPGLIESEEASARQKREMLDLRLAEEKADFMTRYEKALTNQYGEEGKRYSREIQQEMQDYLRQNPGASERDALVAVRANTDDRRKMASAQILEQQVVNQALLKAGLSFQDDGAGWEKLQNAIKMKYGAGVSFVRDPANPQVMVIQGQDGAALTSFPLTRAGVTQWAQSESGIFLKPTAAGRAPAAAKPGAGPTPQDRGAELKGVPPPKVEPRAEVPAAAAPETRAGTPESLARVPQLALELQRLGARNIAEGNTLDKIAAAARKFANDAAQALRVQQALRAGGLAAGTVRNVVSDVPTASDSDFQALVAGAKRAQEIAGTLEQQLKTQMERARSETGAESERLRGRAPPDIGRLIYPRDRGGVVSGANTSPQLTRP